MKLRFIGAIYLRNPKRGEKLLQFFESFFIYLRAVSKKQIPNSTNPFDWLAEQANLQNQRITAYARGNKQKAREITVQIQHREKEASVVLRQVSEKFKKRRPSIRPA
jgi:hypothetical protein